MPISGEINDTSEADKMFGLLDAVSMSSKTGNPVLIRNALTEIRGFPEKTALITAMRDFYEMVLCCKIFTLDETINTLRKVIEDLLNNTSIGAASIDLLIFRDVLIQVVRSKMQFVFAERYTENLVLWCLDNGYIQQAVTILHEKLLKVGALPDVQKKHREKIWYIRNNMNHANGEDIKDSVDNISTLIRTHILKSL